MASRSSRARDPEPGIRSKKEPTVEIREIRREHDREHPRRREHSSHHNSRRKSHVDEETVYVRRPSGTDRGDSRNASVRSSADVRRSSRAEHIHRGEEAAKGKGKGKERASSHRREHDGLPLRKERRSISEDVLTSSRNRPQATRYDTHHP